MLAVRVEGIAAFYFGVECGFVFQVAASGL